MGFAVTNSIDEPRGLASIGLASGGFIPNFADGQQEPSGWSKRFQDSLLARLYNQANADRKSKLSKTEILRAVDFYHQNSKDNGNLVFSLDAQYFIEKNDINIKKTTLIIHTSPIEVIYLCNKHRWYI